MGTNMPQLKRNQSKISFRAKAHESIDKIKRKFGSNARESNGITTEKEKFVLHTQSFVMDISGITHQEPKLDRKTVARP